MGRSVAKVGQVAIQVTVFSFVRKLENKFMAYGRGTHLVHYAF